METIKAKRTSEFGPVEKKDRSGYYTTAVDFEIRGKKAAMEIIDGYENPTIVNWHFITGDHLIDATSKRMSDFSVFEVLDIEANADAILAEAKALFAAEKEKAKEAEYARIKAEREVAYGKDLYITLLKPALEAKGHKVDVAVTKEEFVENQFKKITLLVNGSIDVGHDWHGWVEVTNRKNGDDRVSKTTKSTKVDKWMALVEDVIETDKYRVEALKEKAKKLATAKEKLEAVLGIEISKKSEYHSSYNRRGPGYTTPYFCKKTDNEYNVGIKFVESSVTVDKERVNGFVLSNLPVITDMEKLKKIYELLTN